MAVGEVEIRCAVVDARFFESVGSCCFTSRLSVGNSLELMPAALFMMLGMRLLPIYSAVAVGTLGIKTVLSRKRLPLTAVSEICANLVDHVLDGSDGINGINFSI